MQVHMRVLVAAEKSIPTGLRGKLVQLTLAVLVPVVVFAAWMVEQNVSYGRSQLLASNLTQAQIAAASLEEYFSSIETLLETLARLTGNQQRNGTDLKSLYVPALTARPSLAGIAALDHQGNLLAGLSWDSSQIRSDPFPLPYWPHQKGRPSVSGRLVWPATGEGVVGVSVPMREDDGTLVGELQAWVPLKQLLLKLDRTGPASIVVVDAAGLVLAHPDWGYLDRPVAVRDILPVDVDSFVQPGVEEFTLPNGKEWVAAYAPTTGLRWSVLVVQPSSELYPPVMDALSRWAVFLGMAVLFAAGLGAFVASRITTPLAELSRTALSIAEGDLSKRTSVRSVDELEQLGRAFNVMADSLESTIQQVQDARREVERQAGILRRLLARVVGTQEQERARISRELHDEVHQLLIGAHFQMEAAAQTLNSSPAEAAAQIGHAQQALSSALAEVKRVTLNLRPPRLEEGGLVPALKCLLDEFSGLTGVRAELRAEIPPLRLSPERETAIYRVVQESVSNVRRHSGASNVVVEMRCEDGVVSISTTDDGRGFVPETVDHSGDHLGLTSMRERAEGLGGSLQIQSALGCGTRVMVSVPLGKRQRRLTKEPGV